MIKMTARPAALDTSTLQIHRDLDADRKRKEEEERRKQQEEQQKKDQQQKNQARQGLSLNLPQTEKRIAGTGLTLTGKNPKTDTVMQQRKKELTNPYKNDKINKIYQDTAIALEKERRAAGVALSDDYDVLADAKRLTDLYLDRAMESYGTLGGRDGVDFVGVGKKGYDDALQDEIYRYRYSSKTPDELEKLLEERGYAYRGDWGDAEKLAGQLERMGEIVDYVNQNGAYDLDQDEAAALQYARTYGGDNADAWAAWGQTEAQRLRGQEDRETKYLEGLWRNTEKGARQWMENADGAEKDKAQENYYFVSNREKFAEVPAGATFERDKQAAEDFRSGNTRLDEAYRVINNIGGAADTLDLRQAMSGGTNDLLDFYHFADQQDREVFTALANGGRYDDALQYLEYKGYDVSRKKAEQESQAAYTLGNGGFEALMGNQDPSTFSRIMGGVIGSAVSVPANLASGVNYLDTLIQHIGNKFGNYKPVNKDRLSGPVNLGAQTRKGVMDQVDWRASLLGHDVDVFDFLYGTTMSGIDSYLAAAMAGGLGFTEKAAARVAGWILGSSAASSTMQDLYSRGASNAEALIGGGIAGAFENVFESLSIGKLFKDAADIGYRTFAEQLKNVGREALINFSEEFNTELADMAMDYVLMGDNGEMVSEYNRLVGLGMPETEALSTVAGNAAARAMEAGLGGALMGAGFGVIGNAQSSSGTKQLDIALGEDLQGKNADLAGMAEQLGGDAKKALKKTANMKNADQKTGALFRAVTDTLSGETGKQATNKNFREAVRTALENAPTVGVAAQQALDALIGGQQLTPIQLSDLASDENGMALVQDILDIANGKPAAAHPAAQQQKAAQEAARKNAPAALEGITAMPEEAAQEEAQQKQAQVRQPMQIPQMRFGEVTVGEQGNGRRNAGNPAETGAQTAETETKAQQAAQTENAAEAKTEPIRDAVKSGAAKPATAEEAPDAKTYATESGSYEAAAEDEDVRTFVSGMQDAETADDEQAEKAVLSASLYMRSQQKWIAQHMDDYDQGLARFEHALEAVGAGEKTLDQAMEDEGLDAPSAEMQPVLDYAAEQLAGPKQPVLRQDAVMAGEVRPVTAEETTQETAQKTVEELRQEEEAKPVTIQAGRTAKPQRIVFGMDETEMEAGADKEAGKASPHVIRAITMDEDGSITVRRVDGTETDLADSGLTEAEQTIAREAADLPQQDQAEMAAAYRTGQDALEYARGFRMIREMAMKGASLADAKSLYGQSMTADQRLAAVQAGQRAREEQQRDTQAATAERAKADGFQTLTNENAKRATGILYAEVRQKVSEGTKGVLQLMDRVAKSQGLQVRVYDELDGANGTYEVGTNIINVSLDADEGLLTKVFSHEAFHFIEQFNADMGKRIKTFVAETLHKTGFDVNARLAEIMEQYRTQAGQALTQDEAMSELTADAMLDVFDNADAVAELMQTEEGRTITERIAAWLRDTAKKLRGMLEGIGLRLPEVQALKDNLEYIEAKDRMFTAALKTAAENYRKAQAGMTSQAAQDADAQAFAAEMKAAANGEMARQALDAFTGRLFDRYFAEQSGQLLGMERQEAMDKLRAALVSFGSGESSSLYQAFRNQGLAAPDEKMNSVLSYAARKLAEGEYEKYSLRNIDHSKKTLEENKQKTVQMEAINLHGDEFVMGTGTLFKDINDYYASLDGRVTSKVFGRVSLDKRTVKDSRGHGIWPEKALMFRAVPDVIRKGELIAYEDLWKGREYDSAVLAAPVHVESGDLKGDYYVAAIVHLFEEGENRYYTHYATAIIKKGGNAIQTVVTDEGQSPGGINRYMYNLLHSLLNVKKEKERNQKINDESGAEQTSKTKKSLKTPPKPADISKESDDIRNNAIRIFGKTYNWDVTGYLLTDGSRLDFSGKREGSSGKYREEDHRAIQEAYGEDSELSGTDAMIDFMRRGAIRISPESGGIQLQTIPTKQQLQALDGFISKMRGEVIIEIDDQDGNTVYSKEYEKGTYSKRIISDIPTLFEDAQRSDSDIARFHNMKYSQQLKTDAQLRAEAEKSLSFDADAYADLQTNENAMAAYQLLEQLKKTTTAGGDEAIIRKGAFEERLPEIVKMIREKTNTKMSSQELKSQLRVIFGAMEDPDYSMAEILSYTRWVMGQVMRKTPGVVAELDEQTEEALRTLRTSGFFLSNEAKKEIAGTYGSVRAYMQKNFGRIRIRRQGSATVKGAGADLSDVWRETLNPLLPEAFPEDATEADMPIILDAWLDRVRDKRNSLQYNDGEIRNWVQDLSLDTLLSYYNLPGALKKANEIRESFRGQFDEMRKQFEQLREETRTEIEKAKEGYETRYQERVSKSAARKAETERKQVLRNRITRNVKALNAMSVKPSDNRHVPQEMRAAVLQAVSPFVNTGVFEKGRIGNLANTYAALQERVGEIRGFDEDILFTIRSLEDRLNGRRLSDLTETELKDIDDIMGNIRKMVDEGNQAFINGRLTTIDAESGRLKRDMSERKGARAGKAAEFIRKYSYKETTPIYFAERAGSVIRDFVQDLFAGQNKWMFASKAAKEFLNGTGSGKGKTQGTLDKYHVNDWYHDQEQLRFTSVRGDDLELTRAEALSLYALWKRERTNTVQQAQHLRIGGFMYAKGAKHSNGIDTSHPHPLTQMDMDRISGWLTTEQKAFADEMVRYLSEDMARLGNETSMDLYGYEKFGEGYYFPYETDRRFLSGDLTQQGEQVKQPKNAGFSKATVANAATPIKVGDFIQTWANHVNQMALYNAFALTIDNMNRVLNDRVPGELRVDALTGEEFAVAPESNWAELERALGAEGVNYLKTLVRDVSGGVRADERGPGAKGLSLFKKASVAGNLSVVVQQPTAYARAMMMISPRYLLTANPAKIGQNIKTMMQYSGVANIKKMGKFDTNTGKGAVEWMTDGLQDPSMAKRALGWIDEATGIGAEKADEWTWGLLWGAVENEISHTQPELDPKSDEYYQAVTERFESIINHTQVYDSVLSRSEWMRSTSTWDKLLTSFMSEPTLSMNMLQDAALTIRQDGGGRKFARAAGTFVANALLTALAKSLVTALRKKDEDKTYTEKYFGALAANLSDDLTPWGIVGMIPYVRDAVSIFEGYDVERSDMDAVEQVKIAWDALQKYLKDEDGKVSLEDTLPKVLTPIANLFGIPAKNVYRDAEALIRNMFLGGSRPEEETTQSAIKYNMLDQSALADLGIWDPKRTAYYDRLEQALIRGDMEEYEELRAYLEEKNGVKADTVNQGVRDQIKESVKKKLIDQDKAVRLLEETGMKPDDAYFRVDEWLAQAENAEDAEYKYKKYDALMQIVAAGGDTTAEEKRLTDHGVKADTLRSETKKFIREQYEAGAMTRQAAEQKLVKYCGVKQEDLHWTFDEWQYKTDNGADASYSRYVDVLTAVKDGKDIKTAMKEMTDNGYTEKDVRGQINSQIREWYVTGELTRQQAESKLKTYAGLNGDDLYWRMDELDYLKKNPKGSYKKYDEFYRAVETGSGLQAAVKKYTDHGVKKETLASQITSQYKQQYISLYQSNKTKAAELQARLLTAYAALGYDRGKKQKDIQKWLTQK